MTTDEILERHGLTGDDIVHFYPHGKYENKPVVCDCNRCEGDYAFVRDDIREDEWRYVLQSTGYEIIAYYPDVGVSGLYLVKRKAKTKTWVKNKPFGDGVMCVTATMDYRFGYDKLGRFAAWGRNFVLECE